MMDAALFVLVGLLVYSNSTVSVMKDRCTCLLVNTCIYINHPHHNINTCRMFVTVFMMELYIASYHSASRYTVKTYFIM